MPKRIENLRESMLACAKAELLAHGYDALTIRGVAKACGIAVGTVYNYYPSKDMLAAAVMLEDWLVSLTAMRRACAEADSVRAALLALYGGITGFYGTYRTVWAGFSFSGAAKLAYAERHKLLVRQLADCLAPVLVCFHAEDVEELPVFLAENLLICAGDSDMRFDGFLRIVERLLPS